MQFIENAPFYKLVRITGPQHNLLVLKLASSAVDVAVERLDADRACPNPIEAEAVLEQVVRAMQDYESEGGNRRFFELVQYLAGDSRPVETYYMMTREILKRLDSAAAH
ncbi:MAG TPA: hypothetical protein VGM81_16485 [Burkholderiaceae bacterium]|jgi:hypothetical protein